MSVLEGELGRVGLNESQVEDATNLANELARDFIARNPGLRIDTLEIGSGDVVFTGAFPEVMEGDPDAEPDALF